MFLGGGMNTGYLHNNIHNFKLNQINVHNGSWYICFQAQINCDRIEHCHGIAYEDVSKVMTCIKRGKRDGFDGLTSDYFKEC